MTNIKIGRLNNKQVSAVEAAIGGTIQASENWELVKTFIEFETPQAATQALTELSEQATELLKASFPEWSDYPKITNMKTSNLIIESFDTHNKTIEEIEAARITTN